MDRPDGTRVLTRPGAAGQLRAAGRSLASALRNAAIRNLELGWTLGTAADWALLVVALLVAYQEGGAVLVGLVSFVRMIPAMLVNTLVDASRFGRPERSLAVVQLVRAGACAAGAVGVGLSQPLLLFGAIAVMAAAGALVRPTTMALLPSVAVTPDELVAANVTFALGEAAGTFGGPLLAGLVVAASGPVPAAGLAGVACLLAVAVTARVGVAEAARPRPPAGATRTIPLLDGIRTLAAHRSAAAMLGGFLVQVTVRGALTTYLAILAIDVLGLGEGGVGLLGAAIGLGGLLGSVAALALGAGRVVVPMTAGALAAWGLPIVVIGLAPSPAIALGGLAVVGIANALLDVSGFTLLQRGIPGHARASVFGVLEVLVSVGVAAGGLAGSGLVTALGIGPALVVSGLALPVAAILCLPAIRRLGGQAVVPEERAALLRSIPLFCPLPLGGLELLAGGMRPVAYAAGDPLMREGEPGETYLVIESGAVEVSSGGRLVRTQGPGTGVGEIALLRTVPRTATVVATAPVTGWSIDGLTFLAAVTGHEGSAATAEQLVAERLDGGGSPRG